MSFINNPPHKMVFVNSILLFLVVFFVAFYKFVFTGSKINYIYLLIVLSILPIVSIFRAGSYESGDLTINAAKLMSFYANLSQGNIIPRWSGELNATYGYPSFVFAYPLPYYISSLFHFLGFSFIASIKALLILSYIGSGIVMFYYLKTKVTKTSAFLGSIVYLYSPYHLIDLHFRVDIGETLAFLFMPLVLYFTDKAIWRHEFIWKFTAGLFIAFTILSHQAVSLLFFPVIIGYILIHVRRFSLAEKIKTLIPPTLGLLFSVYYWLPVILESKYTQQVNMLKNSIVFPKVSEFIYSSYRYGFLYQGPMGELSPLLGYANLVILVIFLTLLIKKRLNLLTIYFGVIVLVCLFFMNSISKTLWEVATILKKIEFPFRILSVFILCISIIASYVNEELKKPKVFYLIVFLAIGTSILNWGNRRNIQEITDKHIADNLPLITSQGEGLFPAAPIYVNTSNVWQDKVPNKNLETITGDITILEETRTINKHYYKVYATDNTTLRENTYYFPGWTLFVDGLEQPIVFSTADYPGIITFSIPPGEHYINLQFLDTTVRKYSLFTSLITLVLTGIYLVVVSLFSPKYRMLSIFTK